MKKKWMFLPVLLMMFFLMWEMNPVQAEVTASTRYKQVDYELYMNVYSWLFEIDGGLKYAFCIERSEGVPDVGSETGEWIEIFNEDMRKVLYYGYGGPADQGYNVVETSCAAAAANGNNNTSIGENVLAEIRMMESPPDNFRVWKVETNGGETQDIAFYTTLLTGELCLEKKSADETITEGNEKYSLEGAVYGVYSDSECTEQIGTLTTDENGVSENLTLGEGTYYLKEMVAPNGYELSLDVIEVAVLVERAVTVTVEDEPIVPKVNLTLHKQNQIGEYLQGAAFVLYEDEACSIEVTTGVTDENGQIIFEGLTKGATYYLKETEAPEGYYLSAEIYEITADESDVTVINEKIVVLPNTGSCMGALCLLAGCSCVAISLKKKGK